MTMFILGMVAGALMMAGFVYLAYIAATKSINELEDEYGDC